MTNVHVIEDLEAVKPLCSNVTSWKKTVSEKRNYVVSVLEFSQPVSSAELAVKMPGSTITSLTSAEEVETWKATKPV